jgi:acetoin utilization deacetylase AcuC-like enzyme
MGSSKPFYYGEFNLGNFFLGSFHPMKPLRLSILHDLIFSYGMQNFLSYRYPKKSLKKKLFDFHNYDFIEENFNKNLISKNIFYNNIENIFPSKKFNDCPIFVGIMEYCEIYSGSTLNAALNLSEKKTEIAINWNGGLHHAKPNLASGFCYTNDIVLAILELLKIFSRVLYVDIDVHHGDGVEEAFYLSNRVFTLSFHIYKKDFFPETGNILDFGLFKGRYFSANVPLKNGISDKSFENLFKPIVFEILKIFNPDVIVLQCGADSLSGDKLGSFNLSLFGHANCIDFLKNFKIPLLILGGGGYTIENVAKCWTLETSILIDQKISFKIPYNNFWEFFTSSKILNLKIKNFFDKNDKKTLKKIKNQIINNVRKIKKSFQM